MREGERKIMFKLVVAIRIWNVQSKIRRREEGREIIISFFFRIKKHKKKNGKEKMDFLFQKTGSNKKGTNRK